MATLNTDGVISVMFEEDVTITIDGNTFNLHANTPIGIPYSVTSLTVNLATNALCMLDTLGEQARGLPVFVANEIRVSA